MKIPKIATAAPKTIYGYELIINGSECDLSSISTKTKQTQFVTELCQAINMKTALDPFFWDATNSDKPHVKGTSIVQFLETSSIVIHTLLVTKVVFLNIFSCKEFDPAIVEQHVKQFFRPTHLDSQLIERTYVAQIRD